MDSVVQSRSTYRHGDLRRALIEAGVELARAGGPEAVVLREATRRAGVVPNAAYRHFANHRELLQAVRAAALSAVAVAMEKEFARTKRALTRRGGEAHDERLAARASLRAVGLGYLRFAFDEPGLFRTAFVSEPEAQDAPDGHRDSDPAKTGASGLDPFQLLGSALDRFVEAGLLPTERRPGAEYLAWSTVHGLAMLALQGPLRGSPRARLDSLGVRLVEMVERGL